MRDHKGGEDEGKERGMMDEERVEGGKEQWRIRSMGGRNEITPRCRKHRTLKRWETEKKRKDENGCRRKMLCEVCYGYTVEARIWERHKGETNKNSLFKGGTVSCYC